LEPGVQDNGCPAGQLGLADGSCRAAGVPPELCAAGFVHDGEASCEPILPAEPCPPGLMAVPGESTCHPVMDCGSGKWGTIPVDGSTIYVDAAYGGGTSDGSETQPFTTIGAALAAASAGTLIAVAAGTYDEDVSIDEPVRLWGVCPELVSLHGQGSTTGALDFRAGATGAEVVGLAVTSDTNAVAVFVFGVEEVTLEHLWVHDSAQRGINVQPDEGETSLVVRDSLIERNGELGVYVSGAEVSLEGVVVRDSQPSQSDPRTGRGINIRLDQPTGTPSTASITGSVIEGNHGIGIHLSGSQASLAGVVVRNTRAQQNDQTGGRGINIQSDPTGTPATAAITGSLIDHNREVGVFVVSSQATFEGVVVRDTLPRLSDQEVGRGIAIEHGAGGAPSTAAIAASLVERNHEAGLFVEASQVTLEGVLVRDNLPRPTDQLGGHGINLQSHPILGLPSTGVISGSLFDGNRVLGIFVHGSQVSLEGVRVRATAAAQADGTFGDGIAFVAMFATDVNVVSGCVSEDNARLGLGNFGGHISLHGTALLCNAIDLAGESYIRPFTFENPGGNACGCGEATAACAVMSAGLTPPGTLLDDR
jgi:hypothetical protein